MATTSLNGWSIPADTDLVRNGASAIRTLGNAIDGDLGKLSYTNITPSSVGTGWVLGTGNSASANYCSLGKTVFFDGVVTFGTSAAAGSGTLAIDLPINASTNSTEWIGNGMYISGSDQYPLTLRVTSTDVQFYFAKMRTSSPTTFLNLVEFNNTNKPKTIASGDQIVWSITYQGV
jgi:hypothetical protein